MVGAQGPRPSGAFRGWGWGALMFVGYIIFLSQIMQSFLSWYPEKGRWRGRLPAKAQVGDNSFTLPSGEEGMPGWRGRGPRDGLRDSWLCILSLYSSIV